MTLVRRLRPLLVSGALIAAAMPSARALEVTSYRGMCDASAAEAIDARHFVVASDEDNRLRVYARDRPDAVTSLPLAGFLGSGERESDIEGSARVGRRIYWIASHGRNRNGKERPERYRFFATDIDERPTASAGTPPPSPVPASPASPTAPSTRPSPLTPTLTLPLAAASTSPQLQPRSPPPPTLRPVGAPYRHLLDDLAAAASLAPFKLADAARLAPEAPGGLNIEGLAARPDGSLLIGFRNPLPNGQALLVPLLNPDDLLAGRPARFGEAMLLKLRGRGVRSIERVGDAYLIVAGPTADAGTFSLYRWRGAPQDPPRPAAGADFSGLRPEAMFEWPNTGEVQVLSDDGGVETDGVACKDRPAAQQSFRSVVPALR